MRRGWGIGAVLLLLCGSTACSANLPFGDPEEDRAVEIAEEYLDAIVDGRLEDAHSMLSVRSFEPLPDSAYAGTEHRIEEYTIDEVTSGRQVEATLVTDAGTTEVELLVVPEERTISDDGIWHLLSFSVSLETAVPRINGNGIPGIPVAGPSGAISFHVPRGMYTVRAEAGPLLTEEEQTVDFSAGAEDPAAGGLFFHPELNEEGSERAQQQVDELVERCLEDVSGKDTSCPNRLPSDTEPDDGSVQWTLLKQPTVQWQRADGDHIGGVIEYDHFFSATWTEDGEQRSVEELGWATNHVEASVDGEDELSVEITDLG